MEFVKSTPPTYNDADLNVKGVVTEDDLVQWQLSQHEHEFTMRKAMNVVVASWNVNQKRPPAPSDISGWLGMAEEPHVVAVGLQELDMSANALLREETEASKPWREAFIAALADKYTCIEAQQLAGLYIIVFVQRDLMPALSGVATAFVRCGAMGNSVANKGAIGVRVVLHRTTFCFTTAHLAAHMSEVLKRNRDFLRIVEYMNFTPEAQEPTLLLDHDCVFFFGDLNYRIELPYDQVVQMVAAQNFTELFAADQLNRECQNVSSPYTSKGFRDAFPNFAPTYKYDTGTNRYDTSEKRRVPAWTDRVMWSSRDKDETLKGEVAMLMNFRRSELTTSDHKPIAATFQANVKVELPEVKESIEKQIRSKIRQVGVDRFALPNISLDRSSIEFGKVEYGSGTVAKLKLRNNGHAVVMVSVFSYDGGLGTEQQVLSRSNAWLSVTPLRLRVDPGKEEYFSVKCCIDKAAVEPLSHTGPFKAADTVRTLGHWLVLCAGEQRFWVEVTTTVLPSCFGNRLTHLAACGLVPVASAYELGPESQPPPPNKPQVPKELWWIIDYLANYGRQTPELFQQSDLEQSEFESLRRHLDEKCEPFPADSVDPRTLGQLLLLFLRDLQEPVIPYHRYEQCLQLRGAAAKKLVSSLPGIHYNVFHYIISFLRFLLHPENCRENGLTADLLAQGFAPVLLQRLPGSAPRSQQQLEKEKLNAMQFILVFLNQ